MRGFGFTSGAAAFLCEGTFSGPLRFCVSPAHAHPIALTQANSAHCAASMHRHAPGEARGANLVAAQVHGRQSARRAARQRQGQQRRLPDAKTAQRRLRLVDGKGKKRGGVGAGQVQAKARRAAQHGQPAARAAACAVHERRQHSDMQRQPDQRMSQRQRAGLAQAAPPKRAGKPASPARLRPRPSAVQAPDSAPHGSCGTRPWHPGRRRRR